MPGTICRTCLLESQQMRDLFERRDSSTLAEMLKSCTSIAIRIDDNLPKVMCVQCEIRLCDAFDFLGQCQRSEATLRNFDGVFSTPKIPLENGPGEFTLKSSETVVSGVATIASEKSIPVHLSKCSKCQKEIATVPEILSHQCEHLNAETRKSEPGIVDSLRHHHRQERKKVHHMVNSNTQQISSSSSDENAGGGELTESLEPSSDIAKKHKPKSNGKITYNCQYCAKQMTTYNGLKIHLRRHTGFNLAECMYCNKTFTKTSHLTRHLITHGLKSCDEVLLNRKKVEPPEIECEFCDKKFKYKKSYRQHLRADHEMSDESDVPLSTYVTKIKTEPVCRAQSTTDGLSTSNASNVPIPNITETNAIIAQPVDHNEQKIPVSDNNNEMLRDNAVAVVVEPHIEFKCETSPSFFANSTNGRIINCNGSIVNGDDDQHWSAIDAISEAPCTDEQQKSAALTTARPHVCHVCGSYFSRTSHLTRHMILHRNVLVHKCDGCDKAFATPMHLEQHKEREHINKPYSCLHCNKTFGRGEHLIRHLKVHQDINRPIDQSDLRCSVCDKQFSGPDQLARHLKVHLGHDKRHVCNVCSKSFNRLDNMRSHQRTHSNIKDPVKLHLCVYCGKEFKNSSNMLVHMRRHTGERPYKCAHCGKGFPRSHDLKCHERIHSGEKPYPCNVCGKSFNKSNKLLRHSRVHTGERPYVCNICSRGFTQSNDLSLHMRRHTGARPYSCGVCPMRFIQSGLLKAHQKSTGHWMKTTPDLKGAYRVEPLLDDNGHGDCGKNASTLDAANNNNNNNNDKTLNTDKIGINSEIMLEEPKEMTEVIVPLSIEPNGALMLGSASHMYTYHHDGDDTIVSQANSSQSDVSVMDTPATILLTHEKMSNYQQVNVIGFIHQNSIIKYESTDQSGECTEIIHLAESGDLDSRFIQQVADQLPSGIDALAVVTSQTKIEEQPANERLQHMVALSTNTKPPDCLNSYGNYN